MARICAVSTATLPNSNTTNGNNNCNIIEDKPSEYSHEIQEILNNLNIIKEQFDSNGVSNKKNEVTNGCNGFNGPQRSDNVNSDASFDQINECHRIRAPLLRSTSLMTRKTPSGTPNRKKIVRFADAIGLDLESVRHITNEDFPITVPSENVALKPNLKNQTKSKQIPWFHQKQYKSAVNQPKFIQPSPVTSFMGRVRNDNIKPKNCVLFDSTDNLSITSIIRILNISYVGINDDEEDDIDRVRPPLQRSASFKEGKTPPITPNRKKIVRFADAMGLDLESVRHIISEDVPQIPQSVFEDLKTDKSGANSKPIPWYMQKKFKPPAPNRPKLLLEFIQPSSLINFMDRIRNNKVCLENCMVSNSAGNLSITCITRVLNISFEKSVILRYTLNEWKTFIEAVASYIPNSCDGFSDKFTVNFSVGGYFLSPGQRLKFALKYNENGDEYWDNNMGLNYSLIYRV